MDLQLEKSLEKKTKDLGFPALHFHNHSLFLIKYARLASLSRNLVLTSIPRNLLLRVSLKFIAFSDEANWQYLQQNQSGNSV